MHPEFNAVSGKCGSKNKTTKKMMNKIDIVIDFFTGVRHGVIF